ncbi:MAG: Gfo/Idh/MocA family oxidoreductase [Hamadaea sp.]|uniref:Gfo/Idh/MocA family protein n=1 Tax=Hamadaea sp. TaxID=2024425 RepID=UPI0018123441|nr:Gfo/Idh/MocA family oxidoreductase [Hamadaea sp.]NUR73837.1 Gfo/Idh/MocA family oxidoreductase [Hamadaea sp.]NUT18998.1 Gfo/Idh/MocA family oxidoreductase [Hamadaea sp.]
MGRDRTPPSVVLVGAHGHGRGHLEQLAARTATGRVRLAGVADVRPLDDQQRSLAGDCRFDTDAGRLITEVRPDVVVISTPMHTHSQLALTAFAAGAHVLLEKPPTPTMAEFDTLAAAQKAAGVACQVGFQAFGSGAYAELANLIAAGALGEVRRIGMIGAWTRTESYYTRAAWAGRRTLDGVPVMDGALTNPFAHGVAMALRLDGSSGADSVDAVEVDTYRAHPIEADDTASARMTTASGTPVTAAVTVCAETSREPVIEVVGSAGRAELWYTEDRLRTADGERRFDRADLLDNLLDHVADGVPLFAPLAETRSFMQMVEAIRLGPAATPIDARFQRLDGHRVIVPGVDDVVRQAADNGALFCELPVAWATGKPFRWSEGDDNAVG